MLSFLFMITERAPSKVYKSPEYIGSYNCLDAGGMRLHLVATDKEEVDKWVMDHTLMIGKIRGEKVNFVDDGVNRASVKVYRRKRHSRDIKGMRYRIEVSIWDTPSGVPEGLLDLLDKGKFELIEREL